MFQRAKKLDARRLNPKTKRAALIGDFLDDEAKKKLDVPKEEIPDIPQPKGEELTPVRTLPGGPKLRGEVEEEYTPMSAEEIEAKRKEQEKGKPVPPTAPVEEGEEAETEVQPSFRNVMRDLLKKETPEGKKEQAQLDKYGPPENIKSVIDTLEPFQKQLAEVNVETAAGIIERSNLPDILKERARNLFESRSTGDLIRTEQLAVNLMGARTRKQEQAAKEWFGTEKGRAYLDKTFDMYRTRRVMNMLSNTILAMEGQAVIDQPKGTPQQTKEQRTEKKRIEGLVELLNDGRITDPEFEDAKRTGKTADEVVAGWAMPKKENMQQKVEREYREEEARRREGKASRLNMKKNAEGDTTGPGGDSWEYEWTSGPTPTKDEPQKRKYRFPFRNKPSTYTPGEGDQGNLHDIGPLGGQQDMNYLANIIKSMTKTADNDLFSVYSFDNDEKWLTYTLFKKAYSKFRPGDVVVQYGYTPTDCQTYRRRFGSVVKAKKSIVGALSPVLAAVVSRPTIDDSLHDLQKGAPPGGAYGPRTGPYDQQPEQGNRDGFDAKQPPRQRTKRKFIPHMDTPDDEGSTGFLGGRTMGSKNAAMPPIETPEERAAVIEQPSIKPINKDQKRPFTPKKRWDTNEQQLTRNPNYIGEDSSGFEKARMLLSMKNLPLNMKKAAAPTYEALQAGLAKGQISQEEFDQMVEYYQLTPPTQVAPEINPPQTNPIPENIFEQNVSEWDPDRGKTPLPQERGRLFFGKKK